MGDEPKLALIESDVPKAIINKMKTKLKLRRTHCWRLRCAFADICDEFKPWQKYKKNPSQHVFFAINVPNHGRCSLLGWFVYFVDSVAAVQFWHGRHCGSNDFKAGGTKMFPASQTFDFTTTASKKIQKMEVTIEMNGVRTDSDWDPETSVSNKYKKVEPKDVLGKLLSM